MDTFEAILTRRSIRKFESKKVSNEMIEKILEAGMNAPSAGNEQAYQFIVINENNILEEIAQKCPHAAMTRQASAAILVCGDLTLEKYKGFWPTDCAAAVQNILLAARDLGLGTVWTGAYPIEERVETYRTILNLPENIVPFALIPIGYPAEEFKKADRFNADKIHYNKW